MTAPLEGVMVVALEQAIAAPLATRHLADLGATVLKIERPDGGDFARSYDTKMSGQSAFFVWANRGKGSLALDLKDPAARTLFDELVAGADVFIQNLSPAAARRAGVDAATLVEAYPALVACQISGYGLGGPRTDDKAYDLAIQAEAGAMALTGTAEGMAKVGFSVADISAAMYALSSILAALVRRGVTGEGAAIELSMLECLAEWTAAPTYGAVYAGEAPERSGHRHTMIAPYGSYELADGRQLLVAVQSDREFRAFATQVLDDETIADDRRFITNEVRIANIEALEALVRAAFAARPVDELLVRLDRARTAYAWARDPMELWEHEQLVARSRLVPVSTQTGSVTMYRAPFNLSDSGEASPHVPALNEHDPAVVAELRRRAANRAPGTT